MCLHFVYPFIRFLRRLNRSFFRNLSFGEHIFWLQDIRYVRRMDKERADREQGENDLSV